MTVSELIEKLKEMPQDLRVMGEREGDWGFDDLARVTEIEFNPKENVVVII